MASPYLSEIRIVTFNFAPKGWAFCNGQLLAINQNQALFALLGTSYGGDGRVTFGLPNLQGRVPVHTGTDGSGNNYVIGQIGGAASVVIGTSQMPAHTHRAQADSASASLTSPAGNAWASSVTGSYNASGNSSMSPSSVSPAGGSQSHNNLPPYLVMNFVIALQGIFPSRN